MNQSGWSPDERVEYDALLAEVCRTADATEDRINIYEAKIADAVQAQRFWAGDVDRDARRTGYREQIKGWLKRTRVVVNLGERNVSKASVVGVKRVRDGHVYDAQVMFEVMTWQEINAKRIDSLRQVATYSDSVAMYDRLLALRDLAEGKGSARTPAEACDLLGIALTDYLQAAA